MYPTSPDTIPQQSILERYKRNETSNLLELHNKTPVWNEETQSYVLNFHGRVTQVRGHRDESRNILKA